MVGLPDLAGRCVLAAGGQPDKVIFSGILEPSQTKKLAGIETGQIRVGNAGGVEMKWKGRPIGPLGPSGQPRTVILKKDDNVEILGPGRQSPEI